MKIRSKIYRSAALQMRSATSPVAMVTTCGVKFPPAEYANHSPSKIESSVCQISEKYSFHGYARTQQSNLSTARCCAREEVLLGHRVRYFSGAVSPYYLIHTQQTRKKPSLHKELINAFKGRAFVPLPVLPAETLIKEQAKPPRRTKIEG